MYDPRTPSNNFNKQRFTNVFALICIMLTIGVELGMVQVKASSFDHTSPTVNYNCAQARSSPDGNPFPLCPGPFPTGGNCVWWAWEQWHLLGYDLPPDWGNAADWIVDAQRTGLPLGTTPRTGSIAVFPRADGVWAFGSAGHVAFVTWVSPDATSFNVTYQDYGDPTPMFIGTGYPVSVINEPRCQNGEMRFIYFPKRIDPARFSQLPGVNGNGIAQIAMTNSLMNSRITLGLPPGSFDQEFNFDSSLRVSDRYTITTWDQNSQILVGAFLDHSRCLASSTCSNGDDILVLNRRTGQAKQYVFSFGNHFKVFDNRT